VELHLHPVIASGKFRHGVAVTYWLHNADCTESIFRRATITYRRTSP
jgi:hypothetical protein